jgi:hypothetical protein
MIIIISFLIIDSFLIKIRSYSREYNQSISHGHVHGKIFIQWQWEASSQKIDPRITKVNYFGCVDEGGFGDPDINCNREPDYDIDHKR